MTTTTMIITMMTTTIVFPYCLNCKWIVETLSSIFSDAVTIKNVSDASGITAVAGERIRKNSRTSSSKGW
jgi:hypothetical protein